MSLTPVSRYGGRPLEGLLMQKVDPAFLFELGSQIRRTATVGSNTGITDAHIVLAGAVTAIDQVVDASVYSHLIRPSCRVAASALTEHMRRMVDSFQSRPRDDFQTVDMFDAMTLRRSYDKFETLFLADLQSGALYLVSPKGGYSTDALIEAGSLVFSSDLGAKVPDALGDIREATRCIAFELPTAAGFHLHRAHESVLRIYWDCVTGGLPRPEQNNMGVYLAELERLKKGREEVRSHLRSIKNFHRNPLMHPEQSLESVDQALDLLSAIRCSIGYMLQEIPGPDAPLLTHMEAE